ncbi:hypothetical protein AAVH_00994 [Aphelenchoides avenae]|nr:hypothetical protein AAVH_00994 [Aphelenchus avenae]
MSSDSPRPSTVKTEQRENASIGQQQRPTDSRTGLFGQAHVEIQNGKEVVLWQVRFALFLSICLFQSAKYTRIFRFNRVKSGSETQKFFKCADCTAANRRQDRQEDGNVGTLVVNEGILSQDPDLPQGRHHICIKPPQAMANRQSSGTSLQSFGEAVFETPDKRCVKFKAPGGVIFRFDLLNERSTHDPQGVLGYNDFTCIDCKDHHQSKRLELANVVKFMLL